MYGMLSNDPLIFRSESMRVDWRRNSRRDGERAEIFTIDHRRVFAKNQRDPVQERCGPHRTTARLLQSPTQVSCMDGGKIVSSRFDPQ